MPVKMAPKTQGEIWAKPESDESCKTFKLDPNPYKRAKKFQRPWIEMLTR